MRHTTRALLPAHMRPELLGEVEEISPQIYLVDFLPQEGCDLCLLRCRDEIYHVAKNPGVGPNWQFLCPRCFAGQRKAIGVGLGNRYCRRPCRQL